MWVTASQKGSLFNIPAVPFWSLRGHTHKAKMQIYNDWIVKKLRKNYLNFKLLLLWLKNKSLGFFLVPCLELQLLIIIAEQHVQHESRLIKVHRWFSRWSHDGQYNVIYAQFFFFLQINLTFYCVFLIFTIQVQHLFWMFLVSSHYLRGLLNLLRQNLLLLKFAVYSHN